MRKVTLTVSSREAVTHRALAAFRGEPQGAVISFATPELLWQTLTRKRWELLKAMTGRGPMTIRAVSRELGAYSAEAGHSFRVKRAGDSTRSRPLVPGMPATRASERSDAGWVG